MDDDLDDGTKAQGTLRYRLCPQCVRAVLAHSSERFCIDDGAQMLESYPSCGAGITSPYAYFCAECGLEFATILGSEARGKHRTVRAKRPQPE